MLKRFLFAIAALAFCSGSAFAQDLFLNFGGGTTTTEFVQNLSEQTGEVNIYARNGFDFQAAEFTFTSGDTAVAAFTGGTGLNPAVGPFGDRFDVDPIVETTSADGSTGRFIGVGILGLGVSSAFADFDPTFDADLDAFLLGTVEYDLVGAGQVEFGLEASGNGILAGGVLVDPVFGGPVTLTVDAIPEPSSAILLALGFAGFAARRRR